MREVEKKRERGIRIRGRLEALKELDQRVAVLQEQRAELAAVALAAGQRRRRLPDERPRVRRQPVQDPFDDRRLLLVARADGQQARVLLHHGQQREAEPRIVGDVVVAHDDGVAAVGGFEAKAQVAAHADRVRERDAHAVGGVQRPDTLQQRCVSALDDLEVRRRDQDQRLRIVHEPLAAAIGPLQLGEQTVQPFEVRVRIAVVPDPQREQGQQVQEVVVQQDRERGGVRRLRAAFRDQIVENVDGDDVVVDVVGLAVPVVQDVEAVLARPAVVLADGPVQIDLLRAGLPRVGAHARPQPPQRLCEILRRRNALEDVATSAASQGRFDQCARTVEGDCGHPVAATRASARRRISRRRPSAPTRLPARRGSRSGCARACRRPGHRA